MKRVSRPEIIAVVLLLALSLALRLVGLDRFVANDEIRWTCRSMQFREALREKNWADTYRTGHPGVVTTWLGAAFIPPHQDRAEAACQTAEGGMDLDKIEVSPEEGTHSLIVLGQLLFKGRQGVAIFTWACVAATFWLVRSLFGSQVALGGLVLVALDPFYLALSRVLHIDAVLAGLVTCSLLCLLVARRKPSSGWTRVALVALSGGLAGLAALEKSPALFLAPFSALVIGIDAAGEEPARRNWRLAARDVALWVAAGAIVYVALWPAMWVEPFETVQQVVRTAVGYAEEGHDPGSYFLGRAVDRPDWRFYPVVLLFRESPLTLVGLILSVFLFVGARQRRIPRSDGLMMLSFALLFSASMSLGAKKLDRYLLPIFPSVAIISAAGLLGAVDALRGRFPGIPSSAGRWLIYAAIPLQLILVLPHHPHYLTYYNPLFGGLRKAAEVLKVGWGEGYEAAAAYLNERADSEELEVVVPNFAAFAPLFHGRARPMGDYSALRTDYALFYLSQVQRRHDERLLEAYYEDPEAQPEHIVTLHGVEYVWIYPNTAYVEPLLHLQTKGDPARDVLLLSDETVLGKRYDGAFEVRGFGRDTGAQEILGLLDGLDAEANRVWYAHAAEEDPEAVSRLLENRALLLDESKFPSFDLRLYALAVGQPFRPTPNTRFGDLELVGYEATDPPPAWGRDGGVFLHWTAERPLSKDYSAFVHVYDRGGQRIAQGDGLILSDELRPTSRWTSGTSGTTLHHLAIPVGTPPGIYELRVGVYDAETGERLALVDDDGDPEASSVQLETEVGVPDEPPDLDRLVIARRLDKELAPGLTLLGFDLMPSGVPAGDTVRLTLFWRGQDRMEDDYRLQLRLSDRDGASLTDQTMSLVETDYPTSEWRAGEVIQETYELKTPAGTATGDVTVELDLLLDGGGAVLNHPLELTRIWVQSTEPSFEAPAAIDTSRSFGLGDQIRLVTGEVAPTQGKPGGSWSVTLFWQADGAFTRSYKVFVHVYDEEGNLVVQEDRVPGLGIRPTTSWERGEVIADRYELEVGRDMKPGNYQVAVGMYDPETGARLSAFAPDGAPLKDDRVPLAWISIQP